MGRTDEEPLDEPAIVLGPSSGESNIVKSGSGRLRGTRKHPPPPPPKKKVVNPGRLRIVQGGKGIELQEPNAAASRLLKHVTRFSVRS